MRRAATQLRYAKAMQMLSRDLQVLRAVGRFGQLSSLHIKAILFHDVSATPWKRALLRLSSDDLLRRIERRIPGGRGGGSAQYVYQLGSVGWSVIHGSRYRPARAVSYHSLAVADVFCTLLALSRDGTIRLVHDQIEGEARHDIEGEVFQPDLLITYDHLGKRVRRTLAIEVDMGTQKPNVIRAKITTYLRAKQLDRGRQFPVYPDVLFVTMDERRASDLRTIIKQYNGAEIFSVITFEELPEALM